MSRFAILFVAIICLLSAQALATKCKGPAINRDSLDLIREYTEFQSQINEDASGVATIGHGHLCKNKQCSDVNYTIPLSRKDAQSLLEFDLTYAQNCVTNRTSDAIELNANQYGALVSWAFNIGCRKVGWSKLVDRINKGEDPIKVASDELPLWNKRGGEVLPILERRRKEEIELFETETNDSALPVSC